MRFYWIGLLIVGLGGCATSPVYNPMESASQQELLLNESALKGVQEGMTIDQVHQIMGQELVVGYALQSSAYKPLTIPNPYKSEVMKAQGYLIEYYIQSIRQPDGVIRDDELMPLIFKDGKLIGRGWPLVNSLGPAKSSV